MMFGHEVLPAKEKKGYHGKWMEGFQGPTMLVHEGRDFYRE